MATQGSRFRRKTTSSSSGSRTSRGERSKTVRLIAMPPSGSITRLLKLLKESYGENTIIIQGYNTDAICVLNPGEDCQIRGNTIEFTYYMIGNIYKNLKRNTHTSRGYIEIISHCQTMTKHLGMVSGRSTLW